MAEQSIAAYQAHTGFDPIDAVRYLREPKIDPHRHSETDILLYRMHRYGRTGEMTTAVRDGDAPDLIFMSRGAGVPAFGRMAGTAFKLEPNRSLRVTFVPQGADSEVIFGTSARSTNLMFPRGYLNKLIEEQPNHGFGPLLFRDDARLIELIRMLDVEIASPGMASRMVVEGLSRAIASLLARIDLAAIRADADRIHLPAWKVRRVTDYIDANLARPIGAHDLARVAGLSPFHFSRVFKLATGQTPYHFVCERRLRLACELLAKDDLELAQLALACGFANQSHFTTAFTRAMGMPPGKYRKRPGTH